MLAEFGTEIYYVHEPLGAAHSYASRLTEPATILVADFGGGTTDFSIVRAAEPGSLRRCVPLRSEEHTSELQSLMRISYAVFCLKKKIIYLNVSEVYQ